MADSATSRQRPLKVGIILPDTEREMGGQTARWSDLVQMAQLAEGLGFDSLWNAAGGFHGNWTDDTLDCEYTYYGLLALGHLSL